MCGLCISYRNKTSTTESETQKYEEHISRKEECRKEKERDKEEASRDNTKHVFATDMQAILSTPCSNICTYYYSRKLSSYNQTTMSLVDGSSTAYLWDEVNGKKGCSEVGTVILKHLESLQKDIKKVTMYSDCCSSQNRNQFLVASLWQHAQTSCHILEINLKYLESGHTHMEVDAIHARIEKTKKHVRVYEPNEWFNVITMAKVRNKISVVPLVYSDFFNLKELVERFSINLKTSINGERINWLKIKHILIHKGSPEIQVRYDFHSDFKIISVLPSRTGRRSGSVSVEEIQEFQLP